jgi:hypothetical protein
MRKFLLTGNKFTGAAELIFNELEVLHRIDLINTNMNRSQVHAIKSIVPVTILDLQKEDWMPPGLLIVEEGFVVTFEQFYDSYPLKRNRFKVEKVWCKMDKTEQVKAYFNLPLYKKYLTKEAWQKPMIADRFLRDKEYLTEWNKL